MEFQVVLKPHEGTEQTRRGPIPVRHAQDMIWLNGVHVGYVGHQEGAPVNTLVRFDPHTAERLRQEVARLRGKPVAERARQPADPDELRNVMEQMHARQDAEYFDDDEDLDDNEELDDTE